MKTSSLRGLSYRETGFSLSPRGAECQDPGCKEETANVVCPPEGEERFQDCVPIAGSWGFGVLPWREIRAGSLTEHSGGNVTRDPRKGKFSFGGQGMWLPEDGGWTA